MAKTDIPDRVTLVNGVAETLSKAVPGASTSVDYALDQSQFPIGSVVEVYAAMSYDAGLTWDDSGKCRFIVLDNSRPIQNRASDGIIRYSCGSRKLLGKSGVLTKIQFVVSLNERPADFGFDLVSSYDKEVIKALSAQTQIGKAR